VRKVAGSPAGAEEGHYYQERRVIIIFEAANTE
jgi:hypothetical protein